MDTLRSEVLHWNFKNLVSRFRSVKEGTSNSYMKFEIFLTCESQVELIRYLSSVVTLETDQHHNSDWFVCRLFIF